jgi:hypothetical protein
LLSEICELAHPVNAITSANTPNLFTTTVCQIFERQVVVSCRISTSPA